MHYLFALCTSVSRSKLVSLACLGLVLTAGAVLWPAGVAQAHCTVYHPHHCVDDVVDDVIDTVVPPRPTFVPVAPATRGFRVVNNSGEPVYVARGWHAGGGTSLPAGDYNLPMVPKKSWDAKGWWSVEPYSSRWIYESSDSGEMYFRVESGGEAITPLEYSHTASFCVHPTYGFHSKEYEDLGQFDLMYGNNGDSGYLYNMNGRDSCSEAGGEWSTFYKMKIMTTFTVN